MKINTTHLARTWLAHEMWGTEASPAQSMLPVAKAVFICAQGGGKLSPTERDYLLGGFALRGASAEILSELSDYKATDDLRKQLAGTTANPRVIVYYAIQVCSADGELQDSELARIIEQGAVLGVSEGVVRQLKDVYLEDRAVRKKRIKLAASDRPA